MVEVGARGPGSLDRLLALIRPRVSIVTAIGDDHLSAFHGRDAVAAEKGKLVAVVPPDGIAVLSADDPRVLAMRDRCRARVVAFGTGPDADVRATRIRADWPDRLSFDVEHRGQAAAVHTRLCGELWLTSVLGGDCRRRGPRGARGHRRRGGGHGRAPDGADAARGRARWSDLHPG